MNQYDLHLNDSILELTDRVDNESVLIVKPKFDVTKWENVPDEVRIRYRMNGETNIVIFHLSPKFITVQQLKEQIDNQLSFINLNNNYVVELQLSSTFGSKDWVSITSLDQTLNLYNLFNKEKCISVRLNLRKNRKNSGIDTALTSTKSKYLIQCSGSNNFDFIQIIKKRFIKPDIKCRTERNKNGLTDINIFKSLNRVKSFVQVPQEHTLFLVDDVKDYITIELSAQTIKRIIEPVFSEEQGIFIVPHDSLNHLALIVILKIKNQVILHHFDPSSSRSTSRDLMNTVEQSALQCSYSNEFTITKSLTIIDYQLYDTLSNENSFAGGNCSVFTIVNVLYFLDNIHSVDGSFDNFIRLFCDVLKLTNSEKKMIHLINSFVNNLFVVNECDFDDLLYLLLCDTVDELPSVESFEQLHYVLTNFVPTKIQENNYTSDGMFLMLFLECGSSLDNIKKLGTIMADEILVKHLAIDF